MGCLFSFRKSKALKTKPHLFLFELKTKIS